MKLVVVLYTCDRPKERLKYAIQTLESLANIAEDNLHLHIADDGSSEAHRSTIIEAAPTETFVSCTFSNSEGRGYGANYNLACQTTHNLGADALISIEDDWEMLRPFSFAPLAEALEDNSGWGCIRLSHLGHTQELRGTLRQYNHGMWLELDGDSPEPHIFAGGPRIETVAFQKRLGEWPEGCPAGATEIEVCKNPAARAGVVWPLDLIKPTGDLFVHIGTDKATFEGSDDD